MRHCDGTQIVYDWVGPQVAMARRLPASDFAGYRSETMKSVPSPVSPWLMPWSETMIEPPEVNASFGCRSGRFRDVVQNQ